MKDIKDIAIWCETNELRDEVLKKLEKRGVKWASGHKATEFEYVYDAPMYFHIFDTGEMVQGNERFMFEGANVRERMCAHEFLKNKCVVIYRKDQEVIALDKCTGKKAVAKCSPDDEFDFEIGAKLAFKRLFQEEKKALYNGRICIINYDAPGLTVGKIYEIKDGRFKNDEGDTYPLDMPIEDIEDLRGYFGRATLKGERKNLYSAISVEFVEVIE